MPKQNPKYVAVVGLNFDGLKPPVRVEPGDPIPDRVSEQEIQVLLEQEQIKETE